MEPESFVREGQTLTTLSLLVMRGDMIQTPLKLECIQESLSQLENRIMATLYVRSSTRGTITKKLHFVSWNWRIEISSVAYGFSSIKIDYSEKFNQQNKHKLHLSRWLLVRALRDKK